MKYVRTITEIEVWKVWELDSYCRHGRYFGTFETEDEAYEKVKMLSVLYPDMMISVERVSTVSETFTRSRN